MKLPDQLLVRYFRADEIENIVVRTTPGGVPVRIGDVATVRRSVMPVYTIVTANGKPAVLLNIFRQPDSNTVVVADAVRAEIERIRKELPSGVDAVGVSREGAGPPAQAVRQPWLPRKGCASRHRRLWDDRRTPYALVATGRSRRWTPRGP